MAQGDIWEHTAIQTVHGQRLTNVAYYEQNTAGDDVTAANELMIAFRAQMVPAYVQATGPEWSLICQEVRKVGVTGLPAFRSTVGGGPGTAGTECLNPATVVTIAQFTASGSHKGTGRLYLSGCPVEFEQRNNLSTEGLTACDTLGEESIKDLLGSSITFVPGRQPTLAADFERWILTDTRVILTKLRSRRADTKC